MVEQIEMLLLLILIFSPLILIIIIPRIRGGAKPTSLSYSEIAPVFSKALALNEAWSRAKLYSVFLAGILAICGYITYQLIDNGLWLYSALFIALGLLTVVITLILVIKEKFELLFYSFISCLALGLLIMYLGFGVIGRHADSSQQFIVSILGMLPIWSGIDSVRTYFGLREYYRDEQIDKIIEARRVINDTCKANPYKSENLMSLSGGVDRARIINDFVIVNVGSTILDRERIEKDGWEGKVFGDVDDLRVKLIPANEFMIHLGPDKKDPRRAFAEKKFGITLTDVTVEIYGYILKTYLSKKELKLLDGVDASFITRHAKWDMIPG